MSIFRHCDRPLDEENPPLTAGEVGLHLFGMFWVRRLLWLGVSGKWFFRQCPRNFSSAVDVRLNYFGDFKTAMNSAFLAREIAYRAIAADCHEEAAALLITSATLAHRVYSAWIDAYRLDHSFLELFSREEMKQIQLATFGGLTQIRHLPTDNAGYWSDRLAEVAASLLPEVAAYRFKNPFDSMQRIMDLNGVASVVARWAAYETLSEVKPLKVTDADVGSPARVNVMLARLEVMGERAGDALTRINCLLSDGIEDIGDNLYALAVGVAAARVAGDEEERVSMMQKLSDSIDGERSEFRSTKGRQVAIETTFHEMRHPLETWDSGPLLKGEDLLAVAEILKARMLFDEKQGLYKEEKLLEDQSHAQFRENVAEHAKKEEMSMDLLLETIKVSTNPAFVGSGIFYSKHLEEEIRQSEESCESNACGWQGTVSPMGPTEIQRSLEPKELCIEYLVPRDPWSPNKDCAIIVVSKDVIRERTLYIQTWERVQHSIEGEIFVERGPLSDAVADARDKIIRGEDAEARVVLKQLYEWLIQSVVDLGFVPEEYERWIIVPHGPLHLLPFQALIDPEGRFLIERVAISCAPSGTIWHSMLRKAGASPAGKSILVVGNPKTAADTWPNLPDAEDEANRIAGCLPTDFECCVLTGENADEPTVKARMQRCAMIHFAAHGMLDWRDARSHKIVLSPNSGEDGFLRAAEVCSMDLGKVSLVVLNICDGAVCRIGTGDEPVGLVAAFIVAGVENILGGLWEMPDAASKIYILEFYRNLYSTDPARARQSAAVSAIRKGRAIWYWAGFQLVGSGRAAQ